MKQKNFKANVVKKKISEYERKKEPILICSLTTPESKNQVKQMGKRYEPFLFEIQTRYFSDIRYIDNPILKDIHYAYKKGHQYITKSLTKRQKQVLQSRGIAYRPIKYKIYIF